MTVVARKQPSAAFGLPFEKSFAPRVPKLPNSVFALQRPWTLRGFDVVHYMDSRPPFTFPLGPRVNVVTQHGFAPLLFEESYPAHVRYTNEALLRLLPLADLVITPSESQRDELVRRVRMDPVRVAAIHHGVDHDSFFPAEDRSAAKEEVRLRFGIAGPFVLCVANYQWKKNHLRLVRAFAAIAAERPDITLVLAGWHTRRFADVRELVEHLGLGARVRALGHIGDDALPALYRAAEVFALPSLHETFCMPVVEAMACGTPVVTSNVYCLPEVCGDAAEYVDPNDVESIAEGIRSVLMDASRARELSELGIERAAGMSWQASAERHLEHYERVVSSSAASRLATP